MTNPLTRLAHRLRALVHRDALDRDLSDEMQHHIELETDDLMRTRGLTRDEARREAMMAFGGVDQTHEAHRDARGLRWFDEALQDLRYAVRVLLRSPIYSISAVLILALGIGATTAVFTGVNTVLFSHLPYAHDEQLVRIFEQNSPTNRWTMSVADFQGVVEHARSLSAVGAAGFGSAPVSAGGDVRTMTVVRVTSGYFVALGVKPAAGRAIEPADERPGAPSVVVVGHNFAVTNLGGPTAAIGKDILIDGRANTVVGVLAPGVVRLAHIQAEVFPAMQISPPPRRGPFGLHVIARMADGVTLDAARRDLASVSERIFPLWTPGFSDRTAKLTPYSLREVILGNASQTLGIFAAAVALVLLIAVANVASLTLVRAIGRWPELALRATLGATRTRLLRLVMVESLVLSAAGAVAGIVVGGFGLRALVAIGPTVPLLNEARLDPRAVAFAVVVAILSGLVVGAYPILMLVRSDADGARGGSRTIGGRGSQTVRAAFVVAEFALALPLLAGAGLLLNSFIRLQRVDPGFDPAPIATMRVTLPRETYANNVALSGFWVRAMPTLAEQPGIASVALGDFLPPLDPSGNTNNFDLIDHPVGEGASQPQSPWVTVSRAYFTTFGVKLLEGRLFTDGDTGASPPVVVVSRAWAARFFPGQSAVGRQMIEGGCVTCPRTTVVGVVTDMKYNGLNAGAEAIYAPQEQGWSRSAYLFIRAAKGRSVDDALRTVRTAIQGVDGSVSLNRPQSMQDVVSASVSDSKNLMTLLGAFAASALILAGVGIFGMLSYTVTSRRREIGVRMALGARPGEVVAMVVKRGMTYAVIGAGVGLALSLVIARWLATVLYGVSATDPATLLGVTVVLLTVAGVASWVPARRAAAVDPVAALRAE